MMAVSDARPFLGLGGLPRGVLSGVVISSLFSLEQVLAQPRMAWLRSTPFLVNLAIKSVAMRELREPDAFPAADIGLMRAMSDESGVRPSPAALLARAERWRPWRAYAALHLWASEPHPPLAIEKVLYDQQAA
jgi:AraC family transcriptional regulator, regulatory protein of adaptative response / DNA-3-methyladenine glycosylase II